MNNLVPDKIGYSHRQAHGGVGPMIPPCPVLPWGQCELIQLLIMPETE